MQKITRHAMYVPHNHMACLHNHCCHGKTVSIKYYECVCVFLPSLSSKQIASFQGHILLTSVACLALLYLSTLSHKWHDFHKKVIEYKMCFLSPSASFVLNTSHSKKNSARYHKCRCIFLISTILVRF